MPLPSAPTPSLVLRLELLCARKDEEIAQLRRQFLIERLRWEEGANKDQGFDPNTLTFVEAPAVPPVPPPVPSE